jgi:hypothetical protein
MSMVSLKCDCLCGLVVRVPGYRSRRPGFDCRRYQVFWKILGLERGPLSLVSITEELLGRNSSGSGLENREYGCGDLLCWPRDALYPQKLALTSLISGGHSVGIVRLRTKSTELVLCCLWSVSVYTWILWEHGYTCAELQCVECGAYSD